MKSKKENSRLKSKSLSAMAKAALLATKFSANSACYWHSHQEKLPDGYKKFRKF